MAYAAPTIGAQGLTVPSYSDILSDLLAQYQTIYGYNVYLGVDSPDYQWISVVAAKMADVMSAVQLAYNARSPLTAIGAALDGIVKLNRIARKVASYSTCAVILSGTPGAVVVNGVCKDSNGYLWSLPAAGVTIGAGGTVTVTATCQTAGNIGADPATLTGIATPAAGWVAVTNSVTAVPGLPVESDAALRARQSISAALSSKTMLDGTIAAIAETAGVTRYSVVENATGTTDGDGNPAHSITCIVEGGADADVAQAIYGNRGIGPLTNGTTSVTVTGATGESIPIGFSRPSYSSIYVSLSVHALSGYTTATTTAIQAAIAAYLNSLQIGETVVLSELYGAALTVRPNPDAPMFSIRALTLGTSATPTGTSDLTLAFNAVAQGVAANVVVTMV